MALDWMWEGMGVEREGLYSNHVLWQGWVEPK